MQLGFQKYIKRIKFQVELETTVTIGRCRQLVIKSGAFVSHPLKPVAFYSSQCHSVRVDESAFSRLHRLMMDEIQMLELASYAFRFTTTGAGSGARANIAIRRATMTGTLILNIIKSYEAF